VAKILVANINTSLDSNLETNLVTIKKKPI